ncbi:MAG TPA: sensor domain-containing protein [Streptosporangiaceae bacterium]
MTGTATRPGGSRPGVPRPVAAVLRAPFTRRAWAELGYAMAGLLLGAAGFAFTVATLAAGAALTLTVIGILVGLPLLAVSSLGARGLGAVNRGLARRLLGVRVAAPPPFRPQPGLIVWVRSALTDTAGWRARAYLVLKLPVSVLSGFVAAYFWLGGLCYLTFPLWWQIFHQVAVHVGGVTQPDPVTTPGPFGNVHILTLPGTLLVIPIGAIWVLAAPWATRAANALDRLLIRELLGPVSLSQRVHDLEQTRAYAVDDSAARLRGIERDLHDGTQAQLVAVAMKLGLAMKKLGTSDDGGEFDLERARELVDAAHRSAKEAITDLRDLARGIHPPVLDTGLDAALATLAARSTVPVDLIVDVPQRPPPAIETIAYYCTAELLANVAKHSRARHAAIEAVQLPGLLRLRITDDGTGDARLNDGGGLAGLASRVRTVDGRLEISSPHGGPTVVTIEMPSGT